MTHNPRTEKLPDWGLPYMPYFTHDCLVNDWPPGWLPSEDATNKMPAQLGLMQAERERRAELGIGWGNGSMVMPNSPKHRAPGWLKT